MEKTYCHVCNKEISNEEIYIIDVRGSLVDISGKRKKFEMYKSNFHLCKKHFAKVMKDINWAKAVI